MVNDFVLILFTCQSFHWGSAGVNFHFHFLKFFFAPNGLKLNFRHWNSLIYKGWAPLGTPQAKNRLVSEKILYFFLHQNGFKSKSVKLHFFEPFPNMLQKIHSIYFSFWESKSWCIKAERFQGLHLICCKLQEFIWDKFKKQWSNLIISHTRILIKFCHHSLWLNL